MLSYKVSKQTRVSLFIAFILFITACSSNDKDIDDYITSAKKNSKQSADEDISALNLDNKTRVEAIFEFSNPQNKDPFDKKLALDLVTAINEKDSIVLNNRKKEILEEYSISDIDYMGLILDGSRKIAIVRVGNRLYETKVGNYIGTDLGKITDITDNELKYEESIQDSNGKWQKNSRQLVINRGE